MTYSLNSFRANTALSTVGALLLLAICFTQCSQAPESQKEQRSMAGLQADEARARLEASEGGQVVLRAIEAHGGLLAWYSAPTSSYTWEYSNIGANMRFKTLLVADNQTRRIYHELLELGTPDEPQPVSGAFAWDGNEAWISPASLTRPNPRFWALSGYYFESIPFILADPGLHYQVLPDEALDGVPHDMVRVSFDDRVGESSGDMYTLYVNKESDRVDAIRYTVTYGRQRSAQNAPSDNPPQETLFYYLDYVTVDGLTVATHFLGYQFIDGEKGEFKNEAWASDFSFSKPFDASHLTPPKDSRVEPQPGS